MKMIMTVLGLAAIEGSAFAQNLVPNGSFEEYTECPPYFGFATNAAGWVNLYTQSADYFNSCNTNGVVDVPLSQFGYQYAADGEGYMGMATYAYNQSEYREMVGAALTEPLQAGVPICLSFKMAVGGFGTSVGNSAGYTCKGIGLRFFNELPTAPYCYSYPNAAAIYLDEIPTDTAIWYHVQGEYIPDSAYNYLVVGNFFADTLNEPTLQDSLGVNASDFAYAFLDDIRVSVDLSYCAMAVAALPKQHVQLVYPQPCIELLHLRLDRTAENGIRYAILDTKGQRVQEGELKGATTEYTLPCAGLPSGVFALHLSDYKGSWTPITVVHVSP